MRRSRPRGREWPPRARRGARIAASDRRGAPPRCLVDEELERLLRQWAGFRAQPGGARREQAVCEPTGCAAAWLASSGRSECASTSGPPTRSSTLRTQRGRAPCATPARNERRVFSGARRHRAAMARVGGGRRRRRRSRSRRAPPGRPPPPPGERREHDRLADRDRRRQRGASSQNRSRGIRMSVSASRTATTRRRRTPTWKRVKHQTKPRKKRAGRGPQQAEGFASAPQRDDVGARLAPERSEHHERDEYQELESQGLPEEPAYVAPVCVSSRPVEGGGQAMGRRGPARAARRPGSRGIDPEAGERQRLALAVREAVESGSDGFELEAHERVRRKDAGTHSTTNTGWDAPARSGRRAPSVTARGEAFATARTADRSPATSSSQAPHTRPREEQARPEARTYTLVRFRCSTRARARPRAPPERRTASGSSVGGLVGHQRARGPLPCRLAYSLRPATKHTTATRARCVGDTLPRWSCGSDASTRASSDSATGWA